MTNLTYFHGPTAVALKVDEKSCTGCGRCVEVCPHGVFTLKSAASALRARARAEIVNARACMECGACKKNCPARAIEVSSGVGCAAAIIGSMFRKRAPQCGPECGDGGPCCG